MMMVTGLSLVDQQARCCLIWLFAYSPNPLHVGLRHTSASLIDECRNNDGTDACNTWAAAAAAWKKRWSIVTKTSESDRLQPILIFFHIVVDFHYFRHHPLFVGRVAS
jgi:hypothetical protein